jgi:hypothetical protein
MSSKLKIGNIVYEVPAGSSASGLALDEPQMVASKPETPEPLEEKPYIYRPNDAFQSAVDEARAIASISSEQKPWVIKTWFLLFVIGPLVFGELFALALAQYLHGWDWIRKVAGVNCLILPLWALYYGICRRKVKKEVAPALTVFLIGLTLVCLGLVVSGKLNAPAMDAAPADAAAVAQLREGGSDLNKPHSIDFFLIFPSESGALWAARRLETMGFQTMVRAPEAGLPQWQLVASRSMIPDPDDLAHLRDLFGDLAGSQGGQYDGWETAVVP